MLKMTLKTMKVKTMTLNTKLRFKTALAGAAGLALLLPAMPAQAQLSNSSNEPITIDADNSRIEENRAIFSGQVDARQGDVRVLTDEMIITGKRNSGVSENANDIETIDAVGNFYYITPTQEVRGDKGIYQRATNDFTITGNVILLQDDSVVTGDKLIYEIDTQKARMVSDCKGRKCGPKNRVRVLIQNPGQITSSTQTIN